MLQPESAVSTCSSCRKLVRQDMAQLTPRNSSRQSENSENGEMEMCDVDK